MRRSGSIIFGKLFLVGFIFVISCLPVSPALAQETCDNIYYVVSLSDTFNFSQNVVVVANKPDEVSTVLGCINVKTAGFYKIRSIVSYSDGQENESFFFQVCDKQTLRCTNACDPNLGPFRVVVDKTDVADTTARNAGTFYLTEGNNTVTLTHYAKISDEYPQFINGQGPISGRQSVHITAFVVELVDSVFDVEIEESSSISRVNPAEEYEYRLAVKNVEKATVFFVNLKDVLPPFVTPVSFSLPPVALDADTLFWTFDSLASGDSIIIDINVRVDESPPIRPFNLVNRAWVTGSCDRNSINGLDSSVVVLLPPVYYDLEVKNSTKTDSLFRGQNVTFEIQLKNSGPDTAVNISLIDLLPQNLTFLDTDFKPQRITPDSIYWQIDTFAPGDSIKIKVFTRVNAGGFAVPAAVSNKAVVVSDKDINSANDEATATVKVVPRRADLSVIKTASQDSIFKEHSYTYTLMVENNGPDTALDIIVTDIKPANIIALSFEPAPVKIVGDSIFWRIDSLAVGERRIFIVGAKADTSKITVPAELTNIAIIESKNDTSPNNNEATAIVKVVPRRYDLSVTKTASRDSIFKEQNYSYRIIVENAGPDKASNIIVKDIKSDNIILFSYEPAPVKIVGDTVFWRIDSLAVGESRTFIVGALADTSKITVPAELTNIAIIESENDTEPGNNEDVAIVKIVPRRYNLSVTKTASRDSIFKEQGYSYTITVENAGPDRANNIIVKDVKPDNIIALSFEPAPMKIVGDSIFWRIDSLAVGEQRTFIVGAKADTSKITVPTELTNTAIIESKNDTNPNNDEDTAFIKVVPRRYDLQITKSVSADSVFPGQGFSYTLSVFNAGPDTASSIRVKDVVPSLASLFEFEPQPQRITPDSVFWGIALLAPNETIAFNIRARADSRKLGLPRSITNTGLVFSKRDINSSNDFSTVTNYIVPRRSDLKIIKSASVDSVDKSGAFFYSLFVENVGRDVAERIVLWDLPSSLTRTSDFNITPDFSKQDTLFWLFDSLSVGDFFKIEYAAQAPASVPTTPFEIPSFARIFAENDVNSQNDFSQSIVIIKPENDCIVFDRNVLLPQRGERLEIEFELSTGRQVTIDIYDISGYRIGNLRKEFFSQGLHTIEWDGKNKNGQDVGSGTYLITFKSGGLICYKKIIVVQ